MDLIEIFEITKIPKKVYQFCSRKRDELFDLDLGVYWFWVGLRIFFTIMPQTGYIHPDEYFQSVEVFAGKAFGTEVNTPWEFNTSFPIRSIPAIYLTIYIPLCILKVISDLFEFICGISLAHPYFFMVVPRLSMCALSFVSDICLFKICYAFGQNYRERLIIFASSFVCLVFMTRTFTNSIEVMCFNILVCLVALTIADSEETLFHNSFLAEKFNEASTIADRVRMKRLLKMIPQHTLKRSIPMAVVTVIGFFNRPTFLFFALSPLFYWFQRGLTVRSTFLKEFHLRMFVFFLHCVPIIFVFIYLDSVYYGYMTWGEILNFDIGFKNFVVTPLNFVRYNFDMGNLAKHGVHPRFLHILINIPLMFNVLGMSGLMVVIKLFYRGTIAQWTLLPKSQSVTGMMTLSFIVPVLGLSVIPHQEPRFIIPILLPLIFLYSHLIRDFKEESETVEPFRKRHPKRVDVPAKGMMRYPLKCVEFLKEATESIDNRYNIYGRYLAGLQEQEVTQPRHRSRPRVPSPPRQTVTEERPKKGWDLTRAWRIFNVICIIFYGFLHQGGMFGLTRSFHDRLAVKPRYTTYHLVTTHVYSLPLHLLSIKKVNKSKNTNFALYELGSEKEEKFNQKLESILKMAEATKKSARRNYKLYVALPTSLFNEYIASSSRNYTYSILNAFYPHLSTEALPGFKLDPIPYKFNDRVGLTSLLDFRPFRPLFQWTHRFSLMLLEIKLPETNTQPE